MKKYIIILLIMIFGLAAAYFLLGHGEHAMHKNADKLQFSGAYIPEPVPNASAAAAYLVISNFTNTSDRLVSANGDFADRIEIHNMTMDGDVMRMRQLPDGLDIPKGKETKLETGGLHLMLMGLKQDLKAGSKVSMTLDFENATDQKIEFEILTRGESPTAMEHH